MEFAIFQISKQMTWKNPGHQNPGGRGGEGPWYTHYRRINLDLSNEFVIMNEYVIHMQ